MTDEKKYVERFVLPDGEEVYLKGQGGGLEIGDIGIAPFGIDESLNRRRYLNGQIIDATAFPDFANKLLSLQNVSAPQLMKMSMPGWPGDISAELSTYSINEEQSTDVYTITISNKNPEDAVLTLTNNATDICDVAKADDSSFTITAKDMVGTGQVVARLSKDEWEDWYGVVSLKFTEQIIEDMDISLSATSINANANGVPQTITITGIPTGANVVVNNSNNNCCTVSYANNVITITDKGVADTSNISVTITADGYNNYTTTIPVTYYLNTMSCSLSRTSINAQSNMSTWTINISGAPSGSTLSINNGANAVCTTSKINDGSFTIKDNYTTGSGTITVTMSKAGYTSWSGTVSVNFPSKYVGKAGGIYTHGSVQYTANGGITNCGGGTVNDFSSFSSSNYIGLGNKEGDGVTQIDPYSNTATWSAIVHFGWNSSLIKMLSPNVAYPLLAVPKGIINNKYNDSSLIAIYVYHDGSDAHVSATYSMRGYGLRTLNATDYNIPNDTSGGELYVRLSRSSSQYILSTSASGTSWTTRASLNQGYGLNNNGGDFKYLMLGIAPYFDMLGEYPDVSTTQLIFYPEHCGIYSGSTATVNSTKYLGGTAYQPDGTIHEINTLSTISDNTPTDFAAPVTLSTEDTSVTNPDDVVTPTTTTPLPSLFCTETEWQDEVANSELGQCGKFVLNYTTVDGTSTLTSIRLPKVVNINGCLDLQNVGNIKDQTLPNVTGGLGYNILTDGSVGPQANSAIQVSGSYKTGGTGSVFTARGLSLSLNTNNSTYQANAPVQQEAVQYPYFIQVATDVEDTTPIVNEYTVLSAYSFGDSKYSTTTPSGAWLKSEGQWNSKATYPSMYNWILENANQSVADFKLSTATDIDDYSWVANTTNETFRLPLLDGSESLLGTFESITMPTQDADFTNTYNNGVFELFVQKSTNDGYLYISNKTSGWEDDNETSLDGWGRVHCPANKGDTILWDTSIATGGQRFARYAKYVGNGSLYYYVGDVEQNVDLINNAAVRADVAELQNTVHDTTRSYLVESYRNGNSWYRVYSDGWCEQGSTIVGTHSYTKLTVQLLKPYINNQYAYVGNCVIDSNWVVNTTTPSCRGIADTASIGADWTNSSFVINTNNAKRWYCAGYLY